MEYMVGSVAALVSGNITPSRPRGAKRAATPVKHQPSPNITPKCELVDDRSIFLSPTTHKKKEIVKKSPKRIFQNPDLNVTEDRDSLITLKADNVKKHLKHELGAEGTNKHKSKSSDSCVHTDVSPHKDTKHQKCKKRKVSECTDTAEIEKQQHEEINQHADHTEIKKKKKKSKKNVNVSECINNEGEMDTVVENIESHDSKENTSLFSNEKRKKKKNKKKSESNIAPNKTKETESTVEVDNITSQDSDINITNLNIGESKIIKKKTKKLHPNNIISNENPLIKIKVNPNAITNKDTDSEHESDNDIESENDEEMNEVPQKDQSASEDEDQLPRNNLKPKKIIAEQDPADTKEGEAVVHDPDEVNRTLFVGNVPFSNKCKKEVKKIFSSYGDIETIRIRSVAVKDPRFTPKLAIIRNELHPERSAVNVYVKFRQPHSVTQALVENGRELSSHTLRVSACRAPRAGPEHDAARAVFAGNVPFACADDELRALFVAARCGAVASVRLVRDANGVGKGFGYVNFESKDSVELALALTAEQRTLGKRELRLRRCTVSQRDRERQRGRGTHTHTAGHGLAAGRGRGQTGMRGQGQNGIRGRGHSGMRGGGQSGMRGRGQSGMRGRGHSGMRGRGGSSIATTSYEHSRTDGQQRTERQGAARRLEHKKKKGGGSGGGEFVGLTPDNKTKPKVKTSRQKKALAEIMSK